MLIDEFMPVYDEVERHSIAINAPADRIYPEMLRLDLSDSMVIRSLFALRSIPSLFSGRREPRLPALSLNMEGLIENGFVLLGKVENREVLLGLIGKFWQANGGIRRVSPDRFREFNEPGYARAAWNFSIDSNDPSGLLVRTETRIHCTDEAGSRKFRRYWSVIRPFSGLIRIEALKTIKALSERDRV